MNADRKSIAVINPANEEVIGEVPRQTAADADRAVRAAREAFLKWRWVPGIEKAALLHQVAAGIRSKQQDLATIMTREGGKPFCENRDEVEWTAACFDYYAEIGRNSRGASLPPVFEHQVNFTIKEPYGVVAAIIPWNYPLLLLSWKVAPALAAGNTVIIKPSEETPLATSALAEIFAGLPQGVVTIVTGYGEEIGEALVKHPGTDLIALTGSVETGKRVGKICADQIKKAHLELGGNDPFIVCSDADLEIASRAACWAAYLNTGQVCTGAKRFYIFEATQFQKGFFYEPTVLADIRQTMRLVRTETFGPILPIMRVRDIDEAIELANDSTYGLGANIYTNNMEWAMKAMERITAGTFWINDPLTDNDAGAFGGMRQTGHSRELGEEGLDEFRETKHVHLDYKQEIKPYWYPYSRYNGIKP